VIIKVTAVVQNRICRAFPPRFFSVGKATFFIGKTQLEDETPLLEVGPAFDRFGLSLDPLKRRQQYRQEQRNDRDDH
jgi:hypothetical protein